LGHALDATEPRRALVIELETVVAKLAEQRDRARVKLELRARLGSPSAGGKRRDHAPDTLFELDVVAVLEAYETATGQRWRVHQLAQSDLVHIVEAQAAGRQVPTLVDAQAPAKCRTSAVAAQPHATALRPFELVSHAR